MKIKEYHKITDDVKKLREEVFIIEQGFNNDFDDIDNFATYIAIYENNEIIASCRYYYNEESKAYFIGRVVVRKDRRGKGIGSIVMKSAEKAIKKQGGKTIIISSQVKVKDFYTKNGYLEDGEEYLDQFCPHIKMKKTI